MCFTCDVKPVFCNVSFCPQVELEAVVRKLNGDKGEFEQKLECQEQLLDMRRAKINKLQGEKPQVNDWARKHLDL